MTNDTLHGIGIKVWYSVSLLEIYKILKQVHEQAQNDLQYYELYRK